MPPSNPIQTVAIIGAGPAGRAFALRCAAAGLDVVLEDVMPSNLRRAQDDYTELAITAGSLHYALTVEDAVRGPQQAHLLDGVVVREADVAIDFVPDELESKLEIFSLLDRMAPPRTILCTPTQTLSLTDLASCTYRPGLCIGLRTPNTFDSPLEIIRSRYADPAALTAVADLLTRLGIASETVEDHDPMLVKNTKNALVDQITPHN